MHGGRTGGGLGLAGMAMIWMATPAQAQLYIDVYPNQDNPTSQRFGILDTVVPAK